MISEKTNRYLLGMAPAAVAKNTALTCLEIDTLDLTGPTGKADYMTVLFGFGTNDSGLSVLNMQASDTSASYSGAYTGLDFAASGQTLPSSSDTNKIWAFRIDLRGKPRYWKLFATTANTGTNGLTGAFCVAILSRLEDSPNTLAKAGFAQELSA